MTDNTRIIAALASTYGDLNDAFRFMQCHIRQMDGGLAGMFFGEWGDSSPFWKSLPREDRAAYARMYLGTEAEHGFPCPDFSDFQQWAAHLLESKKDKGDEALDHVGVDHAVDIPHVADDGTYALNNIKDPDKWHTYIKGREPSGKFLEVAWALWCWLEYSE